MNTETEKTFESWGVVEVMGHSRYAGLITEQAIGGCSFVRVDVPAIDEQSAFTKFLGQGAIFAITPCSEEVARSVAKMCYVRPIDIYSPAIPQQIPHDDDPENYL